MHKVSLEQMAFIEYIININYMYFGAIKEIDISEVEIYALGHPICSPPLGSCSVGNQVTDPTAYMCPDSTVTFTYCAS